MREDDYITRHDPRMDNITVPREDALRVIEKLTSDSNWRNRLSDEEAEFVEGIRDHLRTGVDTVTTSKDFWSRLRWLTRTKYKSVDET